MPGQSILFVANKQDTAQNPSALPTVFRQIERWANGLTFGGGGGITQITSADGSVTVTNPTGPVTDLHVAPATGGGYASLTGPGQTVTPGALTQAGGFTVNAGSDTVALNSTGSTNPSITLQAATGILLRSSGGSTQNVYIKTGGTTFGSGSNGIILEANVGGIQLNATGTIIGTGSYVQFQSLGAGNPIFLESGVIPGGSTAAGRILIWTGRVSPPTFTPVGYLFTDNVVDFYFDVAHGKIWSNDASSSSTTWRQIAG